MSIRRFLGLPEEKSSSQAETATVRKIVASLDSLPPERARFIAAFAYILSRVARADLLISDVETGAMERIVSEVGGLPIEQAILIVQMAKTQNLLFGATENYLVTREFNSLATRDDKLGLLRCLFAVAAADNSISEAENHAVRQIARELLLEHEDFIRVRSGFRDKLAVLKQESEERDEGR
jgi:uncharacterized tellurite resistance protein B-like protein